MSRLAVFSALFVAAFGYRMQDPGDTAAPYDYSGLAGLGGVHRPHMVLSKRQGIVAMDDDFDLGGLFKPRKPWVLSRREAEQGEEGPAQLAKDLVAMLVNGTTLEELKTSAEHLKAVASASVNETVDAGEVKDLMQAELGDLSRQVAVSQLLDSFDPIMQDAQKLSVATTLLDKLSTKAEQQEQAGLAADLEYAALEKIADTIVLLIDDTEEKVGELIEFLVGGSLEKEIEEASEADLLERGFKIKLGKGGLSFNHKGKRAEQIVDDDVQDRGFHVSGGVSHSSHGGTYGEINLGYDWGKKRDIGDVIEDDVQDRGIHISGSASHSSNGGTHGHVNAHYNHDMGKRDLEEIEDDVQDIKLGKGGLSFNHKRKRGLEKRKKSGFYVEGGGRYGSHTGAYGQINVGYEWGKRDLEKRKKSGFYVEGGGRYGSHTGAYGQINVGYEWGKRDLEKRKKSGFYVEGGGRYGSHTGAYGQINVGYEWGKRDLQLKSKPIYNVSAGMQQGPYGPAYGIKFGIDF